MKIKSIWVLVLILTLCGTALWLSNTPDDTRNSNDIDSSVQMPWNIMLHPDGSSEVFGIHLGFTTFGELFTQWGMPDSIGLFTKNRIPVSVEVFYKKANTGPLNASAVLTLSVDKERMNEFILRAQGKKGSNSGDIRYILSDADQQSLKSNSIETLTYIPAYRGLDTSYFEERLGRPSATLKESESAISWYYPKQGLTLTIDDEGNDIFQYQTPASFQLPEEASRITQRTNKP